MKGVTRRPGNTSRRRRVSPATFHERTDRARRLSRETRQLHAGAEGKRKPTPGRAGAAVDVDIACTARTGGREGVDPSVVTVSASATRAMTTRTVSVTSARSRFSRWRSLRCRRTSPHSLPPRPGPRTRVRQAPPRRKARGSRRHAGRQAESTLVASSSARAYPQQAVRCRRGEARQGALVGGRLGLFRRHAEEGRGVAREGA